jgi:hypothetical protein
MLNPAAAFLGLVGFHEKARWSPKTWGEQPYIGEVGVQCMGYIVTEDRVNSE